jgi:uridine kinase
MLIIRLAAKPPHRRGPLSSNVRQRKHMRIHITGASGSGTTTLGRALADERDALHVDADNYYWLPTVPPFKEKRESSARHDKLKVDIYSRPDIVLSGSIMGWGREVEDSFDLVVFLYVPAEIRIDRLRERELQRYGIADPAFLKWAQEYDEGPSEGRSLKKHEAWLSNRSCPVLRLVGDISTKERLRSIHAASAA